MRRTRSKTHPAAPLARADRRIPEHDGDAYGLPGKLVDPTACPSCGAMYRAGRWVWAPAPADAQQVRCPACRRIEDDHPAGLVLIEGKFAASHRDEIEGLARNIEERERHQRPLKRIMRIAERLDEGIEVATTDARLARAIGEALHHAYRGELDYRFTESENVLRVRWSR